MGKRAFVAIGVLCASALAASADGLDGERFVPATSAAGGFELEQPTVPFHLGWGLGLFVNVADDPVVERAADGTILGRPVDTAATADLVGSLGLFGRLELGLHLPVHLAYRGDPYGGLSASPGLGDLRFVPKVALVRAGSLGHHLVLSLAAPVSFPTGDSQAFRGANGFSITPELLFGFYVGRLGFQVDAGYRWRSEHPANLAWGDELVLGGGVALGVTDRLTLRGEVLAEKEVNAALQRADFPVEALGGLDYAIGHVDLYAGASLGVTDGIGDPDFRVIGGVRVRGGVPEREGFEDSDRDGVLDKDDRCPDSAEDFDGYEDEDGCPEPDNDEDGVPDSDDECPELAGDRAHNGCPAKTYVKILNGKIFIFGKVQFRTGSAEIDHRSDPLLDQIAEGLNANPQVKHVRIEGHTDNIGGPGMNMKLSEARAQSVKEALEHRNVDGERLQTRGRGESHPIAPNRSPAGRAKNRRVEFLIVEGR